MPTIPKPPKDAPFLSHLAYWLSVGLGSGLSPKAPGTVGSLAALACFPLWLYLGFWLSLSIATAATVAGVWICGRAAHDMGIHDSGHIVWDEWVGQWLALMPLVFLHERLGGFIDAGKLQSITWLGVVVGFVLFRFFDIVKPWPIRAIDKKVSGGLGIMLDDIIAGIAAAVLTYLALALYLING